MKKNILAFSLFSLVLFSCGDKAKNTTSTNLTTTSAESSNKKSPATKESGYKRELEWTAYKTNKKIPVTGTFLKISLTGTKEDKSFPESLEGAKFSCDGTSTSTGDTARDGTLITFFFKRLSNTEITGYFGKFENNKVSVIIDLNGKSAKKDFTYSVMDNRVTIKGSIDILTDFNAQKPFTSLHRACYDLHEGKTWTEVDLVAKISK